MRIRSRKTGLAAILGVVGLWLAAAAPAGADYYESMDWFSGGDPCISSRWPKDPAYPNDPSKTLMPDLPFVASGAASPASPLGSPVITHHPWGGTEVRIDAMDCDPWWKDTGAPIPGARSGVTDKNTPAGVDYVEYWVEGAGGPRYAKVKRFPLPPALPLHKVEGAQCPESGCRGLRVTIEITTPGTSYIRYRIVDLEGNASWQPTITVNVWQPTVTAPAGSTLPAPSAR